MHEVDISPLPMLSLDLLFTGPVEQLPGVHPPRAASVSSARVPIVTAVRHATVNAVRATSTAAAYKPTPLPPGSALVVAPLATGSQVARIPAVGVSVTVNAVVAQSNGVATAPLTNILSATVIGVKAGSTGKALPPVLTDEIVLTGGGPGTSSSLATPPTVTGTSPAAPAPAFAAAGVNSDENSSTTVNIPVPPGVVAGNIVMVFLHVESTQTVTPPAGFAEAPDSPVVVGGSQAENFHILWKRASASDTGNYTFTIAAGLGWRSGFAARYVNCATSGSPFDVTASAVDTNTSATVTPAVSDTTTGPNRLWVWAANCWQQGTFSTLAGFTEDNDGNTNGIAIDSKVQASAGSSGSLVSTFSNAGSMAAWLGALVPASVLAGVSVDATSAGTGETDGDGIISFAHTCGAGATILVVPVVVGKYDGGSIGSYTRTVTYNGQALTSFAGIDSGGLTHGFVELFYLMNPPTGSAFNVVFTTSLGTGVGTFIQVAGAVSYNGVLSVGAPVVGQGTTNMSLSVPSATDRMVMAAFTSGLALSAPTDTQRILNNYATGLNTASVLLVEDQVGATTAVLGGTVGALNYWGGVAIDLIGSAGATPTITGISPNPGPAGTVTITGTNFISGATVSFGGVAATNVSIVNSTQLTCTAPAHANGAVSVTVTTSGGTSNGFVFTYQAVVTGNKLLIPSNVRIRGTNIAPDFGGQGSQDIWASVWTNWNWAGWLQPQIFDASTIGNAIRFWGNTKCVADGTITQATYLSRWRQALDYAVGTLGLYVYPTGGAFGHWGTFNQAQAVALYTAWADVLADYAPNIIGVDIANEAWSEWFYSGGETGTHQFSTTGIVTLSQALCDVVRTHAHVPVTLSQTASAAGGWIWRPTTPANQAVITQMFAMSDFLDMHVYYPSTGADVAAALATAEGLGKNIVFGEFGCSLNPAGDTNRDRSRTSWYDMVGGLVNSSARVDGCFAWTCWDLSFNATGDGCWGVIDPDTRTPRTDISVSFSGFPTSR